MRSTSPGLSHAQLFRCSDKWSVVELGLQGVPLPTTPLKTPSKKGGFRVGEYISSPKTTSPNGEKHTSRSPRTPSRRDTPERNRQQGDAIKSSTPTSPVYSQDSHSYLADFSTLCYADASRVSHTMSRRSRALVHSQRSQQQTRGRLGQVVRNFVKRMLPPGTSTHPRTRQGDLTPRSDVSGESEWSEHPATNRWSGFWHH